ncbi:MAG: non-homologous end-joining DNA ligase [Candidatus Dependentiae bacterium]
MKHKPMLAKIGKEELLEDNELIFEPKLDGYRALCEVTPKSMKFYSRRGIDITQQFPEFDFRNLIDAKSCILDGEIIVYNKKGLPDFNLMQGRSQLTQQALIDERSEAHPATYAVFDILTKDGKSLLKKPFIERHDILYKTIKQGNHLELLPWTHNGKKLFQEMKQHKLEGVIAKDPQGIYEPGKRTRAWQKVKFNKTVECVVLGFTQEKKLISSLALGLYDEKGKLHYVGRVGTGFSQDKIDELYPKLLKYETAKPAAKNIAKISNLILIKPNIVVEIKYLEMSKTGTLRHTSYVHYRDDKKPKACTLDQL